VPSFLPKELALWSGGVWQPAAPEVIEGVSNDSRTLKRGEIYFALKGRRFDGHQFVGEAFLRGAGGAVVRSGLCPASGKKRHLLRVADTAKALRDIASAYRFEVSPEIVAVTGTAGKSTVKEITADMLSTTMPTARTPGNWNNNIGLPLSLLAMERSSRIGVFEIGTSRPGEIQELSDILRPTWGVVTNVGPGHIGFFDSLEAIAHEKACLLKSLPVDGVAVLSRDSAFFELFRSVTRSRIVTVSTRRDADYVCSAVDRIRNEAVVEEKSSGKNFRVKARLPGEYSMINIMFAIAVARGYGVTWDRIAAALESYTPLPMRWEHGEVAGIKVINDAYNANPLSIRVSIKAFSEQMIAGKKWLVLGGMLELGDRQKEEHLALGEFVGSGDWGGLMVVGSLGELIAQGAEKGGLEIGRVYRCENNEEAAKALAENVAAGDAVLLKASRAVHLEEVVAKLEEVRED